MLSYIEAQHIIKYFARSFGMEKVSLDDALGRVLAEKIIADRDYPPFNRAAMDGYAIRFEDFEKGIKQFKVIDTIYAGGISEKELISGECYKIMTGAAVPLSADSVIRREDAEEQIGFVSFSVTQLKPFQNIARKGEDLQNGITILDKAQRCNASVIGLLASVGKPEVLLKALPSVAIITTGNEVVDVRQPVNDVQIRNSNFYVLKALLKSWGIQPSFSHHVLDNVEDVRLAVQKALQYDIVILNGGVSAGDADYVPSVLKSLGVEELFHKVAIRPGKPFWCGRKQNTMVFALPGNPISCLVTFTIFIRHYFESCFGINSSLLALPMGEARKQRVKLDEFFPVEIKGEPSKFHSVLFTGSGDIRMGFEAKAFALHPQDKTELKEGETISAYLL